MWRELSPLERTALKKARNPLSKAITFVEIVLLLFPLGFGIDHLITLITKKSYESIRGLAVDICLCGIIVLLAPRVKKALNSDVEAGELMICEAVVDSLELKTIDAAVVTSVHKEYKTAHYVTVHPVDAVSESYKVKVDVETYTHHKEGDVVLLVSPKDETKAEFMQLLEVK